MATKGAQMAEEYSKDKSFKMPKGMFYPFRGLCRRYDTSQSVTIRRALAVLIGNPGLWDAYAELASPEQLDEIERGE